MGSLGPGPSPVVSLLLGQCSEKECGVDGLELWRLARVWGSLVPSCRGFRGSQKKRHFSRLCCVTQRTLVARGGLPEAQAEALPAPPPPLAWKERRCKQNKFPIPSSRGDSGFSTSKGGTWVPGRDRLEAQRVRGCGCALPRAPGTGGGEDPGTALRPINSPNSISPAGREVGGEACSPLKRVVGGRASIRQPLAAGLWSRPRESAEKAVFPHSPGL